jgi:IS5 family transposase
MQTTHYRKTGNISLFDREDNEAKLRKIGNPLERLSQVIDFELFRPTLEDEMLHHDKKSNAGAKPIDVVLMFKVMILQRYYNISDEDTEYQLIDRLSFRNFLGLSSGDKIPDARTIWLFKNKLAEKNVTEKLFAQFSNELDNKGLFLNQGQIIDASFVEVPRQRNKKAENEAIKEGKGEELWNEKPYKKRQKDVDARWTKKNHEIFYGYKDHIKEDGKSKLIKTYQVTDASVHDSQPVLDLLDDSDNGQSVSADSAYTGEPVENLLKERNITPIICAKGYRNKPLTEEQKKGNTQKSRFRSRVEHVFGFIENSMHGSYIRSIGIKRAKEIIGLINLTYNFYRYEQIVRLNLIPIKN